MRNAGVGVRFRTLWTKLGNRPAETSDNRILNNLFFCNVSGQLALSATNEFSHGTVSDGNAYVLPAYPPDGGRFPFRFSGYNIGSVKWRDLHAELNRGSHAYPFEVWRGLDQPLGLVCWRRMTGFDASSQVARGGRLAFSGRDLAMAMSLPEEVSKMQVRPVRGLGRDFFGTDYAQVGQAVLPGPFQACFSGTNVFRGTAVPVAWGTRPPLMKWDRDFTELFTPKKKGLK